MKLSKDVYEYITNFTDDKDTLSMLSVNKKFRGEEYFKRVLERKYPLLLKFRHRGERYRRLYLRMIISMSKLQKKYGVSYVANPKFNPERFPKVCYIRCYIGRLAAEIGDIETMDKIMRKEGDGKYLKYFMEAAASKGNMTSVKYLLEKGLHPNEGLGSAALKNQKDVLNILLEKGATDYNKGLIYAALGGHMELLKFFIDKGANFFNGAMYNAINAGNIKMVKYLIEKGADDFGCGLAAAATAANFEMVKFFMKFEEVNEDYLNMALKNTLSSSKFKINIIEYLIDRGATGLEGGLFDSCYWVKTKAVKYLVERGGMDINSAFVYTARYRRTIGILKYLHSAGATNVQEAIDAATKDKNVEAVKFLQTLV
jgi:hypothetical protein